MHHKQLNVIFSHLKESRHQLKNVTLPLGPNRNLKVDVVCPVLHVIADTEGADKMCGWHLCYSRAMSKRCQACDISKEHFSKPEALHNINDSATLTQM